MICSSFYRSVSRPDCTTVGLQSSLDLCCQYNSAATLSQVQSHKAKRISYSLPKAKSKSSSEYLIFWKVWAPVLQTEDARQGISGGSLRSKIPGPPVILQTIDLLLQSQAGLWPVRATCTSAPTLGSHLLRQHIVLLQNAPMLTERKKIHKVHSLNLSTD